MSCTINCFHSLNVIYYEESSFTFAASLSCSHKFMHVIIAVDVYEVVLILGMFANNNTH